MPRLISASMAEAPPRLRSSGRSLSLALVWLTVASGAVVFSEPAPFDLLMIVLIGLLPLAGLVSLSPGLVV
ncbi:MAG: O-antigen ligase domain-containing protein, partial [Hyphomicrobiaceae bacterium]